MRYVPALVALMAGVAEGQQLNANTIKTRTAGRAKTLARNKNVNATFSQRRFGVLIGLLTLLGPAPGVAAPEGQLVTRSYDLNNVVPRTGSAKPLIDVILNTVASDTWDVMGGEASLKLAPNGRLVIDQEPAVHATLDKLLAALTARGRQGDRKHIVVGEADAPRIGIGDLSIVVYDVSDLVQFAAGGNLQESIDTLQSTIAPESWSIVGGEASVMPYGPAGVFVIRQSKNAHQAIEDALKARRAHRPR